MRALRFWLLLTVVLVCFAGFWLVRAQRQSREPVKYESHTGNNPIAIQFIFSPASTDLGGIAETSISQELRPGQLLAVEGALAVGRNEIPRPVLVEFIETREGKSESVANTAVAIPQNLQKISIPVNAPTTPGVYTLRVVWGGGKNYIARAKVVVHRDK